MQKTGCVSVLALGLEQKAATATGSADSAAVLTTETESQTWKFC